jgi:hypothetical protein
MKYELKYQDIAEENRTMAQSVVVSMGEYVSDMDKIADQEFVTKAQEAVEAEIQAKIEENSAKEVESALAMLQMLGQLFDMLIYPCLKSVGLDLTQVTIDDLYTAEKQAELDKKVEEQEG